MFFRVVFNFAYPENLYVSVNKYENLLLWKFFYWLFKDVFVCGLPLYLYSYLRVYYMNGRPCKILDNGCTTGVHEHHISIPSFKINVCIQTVCTAPSVRRNAHNPAQSLPQIRGVGRSSTEWSGTISLRVSANSTWNLIWRWWREVSAATLCSAIAIIAVSTICCLLDWACIVQ